MKTIDIPELPLENFTTTKPAHEFSSFLQDTESDNFTRLITPYFTDSHYQHVQHPFVSLGEMYKRTDEHLENYAQRIGAQVIPHTFGLVKAAEAQDAAITSAQRREIANQIYLAAYFEDIVPNGFLMAAAVPVIKDVAVPDLLEEIDMQTPYSAYVKQKTKECGYFLIDVYTEDQYVFGRPAVKKVTTPSLYLVDIEPLYSTS